MENKRIQKTEDDRVRTDRKGQCKNSDDGEAAVFIQHAKAETYVLPECFEELASKGFVTLLSIPLIAAEFDASATLSFGTIET